MAMAGRALPLAALAYRMGADEAEPAAPSRPGLPAEAAAMAMKHAVTRRSRHLHRPTAGGARPLLAPWAPPGHRPPPRRWHLALSRQPCLDLAGVGPWPSAWASGRHDGPLELYVPANFGPWGWLGAPRARRYLPH